MKKKILSALILAGLLATPLVSTAADNMIGTWAYSLSQGAANVYYQGKLDDNSAWLVDVGSAGGATVAYGFYKGYIEDYANGPYWKVGAVYATIGGSSGVGLTGGVGYEATVADNFVVGAFLVVIAGSGGSATAWDVSMGYKF